MLRQKCPSGLRIGSVLYSALFHIDDNTGKATAIIYEEVVRSIRRRPNSSPDSSPFVRTVTRIEGLTWLTKAPASRRGSKLSKTPFEPCWATYIPEICQKYFSSTGDLPFGLHTTRLMAIKSALNGLSEDLSWYVKEIAGKGDAGVPEGEHLEELLREKGEVERCIRLAKTTLTKERNKKKF
ncbi:hypothetical protein ACI0X9_003305 [Cronobacter turicensis]